MKKTLLFTLFSLLISVSALAQFESAPAFPGAEGHGRFVTGGRGGTIIHVTNLNDSGEGSFRNAVKGSNKKIIVFDVAGVIALESDLTIDQNTTVLGQTAPYPGITLRYRTIRPKSNCIIRFMRFRLGNEKTTSDGADATWQREITGLILDHCSFSWSIDEVASFYDNNNFTMQWCTLGESLCNAGHGKGAHGYGGIWGGKLASFHHNMITHVANRGPRFNGARYGWAGYSSNYEVSNYNWETPAQAENVDFRNCVMYDAQGTCYGGPGGGQINIVNNYYKAGKSQGLSKKTIDGKTVSVSNGKERGNQELITTVTVSTADNSDKSHPEYYGMTSRYFISGNTTQKTDGTKKNNRDWSGVSYDSGTYGNNVYSADKENLYGDGVEHFDIDGISCVKIKMEAPAPTGNVTTHSAATAFDKVLNYAGASLYRDDVDERYVREAKNGTCEYKGSVTNSPGLIDNVSDCKGYTEENFPEGKHPDGYDSDNDGMPDEWETTNGLNPNDASDAKAYTLDPKGYYTNIEVYANSIVESIMKEGNEDADSSFAEYYPHITSSLNTVTKERTTKRYYNVMGQEISQDSKGIIICNGHKFINK